MSIKSELKSGIIITFLARYSNIFIQIIVTAILARLLSPEEFGIVAVVLVFINFFSLLADMGIGPAIIQNKNLKSEDYSVIFNFTIIIGIVLAVFFNLFSLFIADFYSNDEYITIGKYLSLTVFFFSLNIVPQSLLRKAKRFKAIGITEITVNTIVGFITIVLAYKGMSYFSLVWQSILRSFILFLIYNIISQLKIRFMFSLKPIKEIFNFSIFQFLFNILNYFSRNMDKILIGRFIGAGALGYYDKAYRLMLYPVQNLTHVITPVLHPVLSDYQNNKEVIYSAYSKVIRLLAILGIAISVFLFFAAEEAIVIFYGDNWLESVPTFQILACTIGIQMILSSSGSIFQATGRTDLLFYAGLFSSVLNVTGIFLGIFMKGTIEWVSIGLLISFSINFLQCYWMMYKYVFKMKLRSFFTLLIKPLFVGIVMITGYLLLNISISNTLISLFYKIILGLILFIVGCKLVDEPVFNMLLKRVKKLSKQF